MKIFFAILINALFLTSCGSIYTTNNDLIHLKKGASPEEMNKQFDPKYLTKSVIPNSDYVIYKIGIASSQQQYSQYEDRDDKYKTIKHKSYDSRGREIKENNSTVKIKITEVYSTPFYMIYYQNKLINWGYLYELKVNNYFGIPIFSF